MSLTYSQWLAAAANLADTTTTQPNFVTEAPNAIDYAEGRIFRDLNLLVQITTDSSQTCVPNQRKITVPAAFVAINGVNVITPAGTAPDNGKRNQCQKVSEDFLDACWPSSTGATLPTKFALLNQGTILLGPWPDQGYVVEYVGTQRPAPLSASNASTFLSTNLPDLFLAATMIHLAGYQKNFGAQADDPRMAMSWETQYGKLLESADAEELRKRYAGTIVATPPGYRPSNKPQAAA